jgi:hypothetical protein
MILGKPGPALLHSDIACAIALGVVDNPNVTATLDALVVTDPQLRTTRTQSGWLEGTDPLVVATRNYLTGRRDAMLNGPRPTQTGWAAASAVRAREAASARANQARSTALKILQTRGVLHHARRAGMTIRELN